MIDRLAQSIIAEIEYIKTWTEYGEAGENRAKAFLSAICDTLDEAFRIIMPTDIFSPTDIWADMYDVFRCAAKYAYDEKKFRDRYYNLYADTDSYKQEKNHLDCAYGMTIEEIIQNIEKNDEMTDKN